MKKLQKIGSKLRRTFDILMDKSDALKDSPSFTYIMKLIKIEDGYNLISEQPQGRIIEATCSSTVKEILQKSVVSVKKLSLKNCETIFNGYDLDELAREACDITDPLRLDKQKYKQDPYFKIGFNKGFQKALEILGADIFEWLSKKDYLSDDKKTLMKEYYQQPEIEVEIVMGDFIGISDNYTPENFPKLDADGCLILKRK